MAAPDEETETQSNVSEVCLYDFGPEKYDDSPEDDTLRFIEQLDQLSSGPPTEIKEIPLQLEKELVFAYRETYLQGRIKTQQVEPLGEKWYDCLSSDCANTFKNVFGARQHISLGQDWIHTMILEDYPGILHSEDREVGDAMVFAACARLYSRKIFSIGQNPDLSEFEIELSLSDKDLSSKTPYSIIICRTEDEAWSIGRLVERLLPAGIFWDHANENLIETENEEQHKHASLVIGTVHCVNVYLKKFLINTGSVESIYLTGSELYSPGSRRERSLMEIISYVRRQRSGHISSFLISATASPLTPVCRHLLSDNYSVVAIPKKTDVVLPDVKICLINTDDPGCHFFKKLACLMALVQKNINEDPKTKKTTIIVCEKEETCNFFATFLTLKFQIKVLLITRNIHPLEFERTKNLFYARVSDFLVMDYHALRFLESGDFAKIIAFDLPKPVEFSTKMGTFFRLSQKVTREKVVYLIMNPNVDRQLIVPVHKLLEKLGSRISTTFHALYVSLSVL